MSLYNAQDRTDTGIDAEYIPNLKLHLMRRWAIGMVGFMLIGFIVGWYRG